MSFVIMMIFTHRSFLSVAILFEPSSNPNRGQS
jgi:hypothetical protein